MKTMKSKRRISTVLSTVLSISMLAGVLSTTALAAETTEQTETEQTAGKAINLGTSGLQGYNTQTGSYNYLFLGINGGAALRWRVLDAEKTNDEKNGVFLLTNNTIGHLQWDKGNTQLYQNSEIRKWLRKVSGEDTTYEGTKIFDAKELNALLETTKTDYFSGECPQRKEENILNKDKLFLLSYSEFFSSKYGFNINSNRILANEYLYTRSTLYNQPKNCLAISPGNNTSVSTFNKNYNSASLRVRPGCNLNPNQVLFTSAANNSGHKETFTTPDTYDDRMWKLTLKDDKDFSTNASISGNTTFDQNDKSILTITHAKLSSLSSDYTHVTAVLSDENNNIIYYGSINSDTAATTSTVTIPSGLTAGTYTLSIYGEDWNNANFTDYATGTPFTQEITVTAKCTMDKKGIITLPDGKGTVKVPADSTLEEDGSVKTLGGTIVNPDGTIKLPSGDIITPNKNENGENAEVDSSGNVTLPSGGTKVNSEDTTSEGTIIESNSIVKATDGTVIKIQLGDVNGNGIVNLQDLTLLQRHLAGGWNVEIKNDNCDMDQNGKVNLQDLTLLQQKLVETD